MLEIIGAILIIIVGATLISAAFNEGMRLGENIGKVNEIKKRFLKKEDEEENVYYLRPGEKIKDYHKRIDRYWKETKSK